MRAIWSLAAVLIAPAGALAQPLTGQVTWQASGDGGATWRSYLPLAPGSPYKVRAVASWTEGVMPTFGLTLISFEQVDLVGAGAGDVFDIESAYAFKPPPEVEPWTVQAGTGASEGFLKIDNIDPIRRVIFGQLPKIIPGGVPNPDFTAANPLLLLEMDAVAAADPSGRIINISGTWTRQGTPPRNQMRVYTTETGSSDFPMTDAMQTAVTIDTIIPAPSGGVVLGIGMMAGASRRRRGS